MNERSQMPKSSAAAMERQLSMRYLYFLFEKSGFPSTRASNVVRTAQKSQSSEHAKTSCRKRNSGCLLSHSMGFIQRIRPQNFLNRVLAREMGGSPSDPRRYSSSLDLSAPMSFSPTLLTYRTRPQCTMYFDVSEGLPIGSSEHLRPLCGASQPAFRSPIPINISRS
jgi:hypothetical protein